MRHSLARETSWLGRCFSVLVNHHVDCFLRIVQVELVKLLPSIRFFSNLVGSGHGAFVAIIDSVASFEEFIGLAVRKLVYILQLGSFVAGIAP